MKAYIVICIVWVILPFVATAQDTNQTRVKAVIFDGDTIPVVNIQDITILPPVRYISSQEARRYAKLEFNVRKVYPYARLAGVKFRDLNEKVTGMTSEKEKKSLMKQTERDLKAQFGKELEDLTFSQGKILIKLVDRETQNSTYDIVREFRGSFQAFFWQTFASVFGYDLKVHYDPQGADQQIEYIVRMIEEEQK